MMPSASVLSAAAPNVAKELQEQEQERRVLAVVELETVSSAGGAGFPPRRKITSANPPVQIFKLRVTDVGQSLAVVSVTHGDARGAMAKVCRALESLRPKVIAGSVATLAGGTVVHTMFVETEGVDGARWIKEMVEAALAQLHVLYA